MVDASSAEPSAGVGYWTGIRDDQAESPQPEHVASAAVPIEDLMSEDDANLNPKRWVEANVDHAEIADRHNDARRAHRG
jgi:hypothetical protein